MRLPTDVLLYALAFCLGWSPLVWANTEIVNFDASQAAELLLTETNEWYLQT